VAISYDSLDILRRFTEKRSITYPLLSDPKSAVIDAYGIRNLEAKGSRIDGVPYPGTFIIDGSGFIRAKLFYEGYRTRHTSQDIVAAVRDLGAGGAAASR